DDLAERTIKAVIPGRSNRRVKIDYDRALYRQRNRMERMFGHLKINRAIATRYDQLANSFLGMVHIALRWSRLLGQVGGEVKLIPDVIMPPVWSSDHGGHAPHDLKHRSV